MNKKIETSFLILFVIICGIIGAVLGVKRGMPTEKVITINARQYAFEPNVIRINRGDKITLKLLSEDVTHGFYLEGYDFDAKLRFQTPGFWMRHPSKSKEFSEEAVGGYTFTADRVGKFRYRCSIICGPMHPFMQGEMIVEPNYLFPASIGIAIGMALSCIIYFRRNRQEE